MNLWLAAFLAGKPTVALRRWRLCSVAVMIAAALVASAWLLFRITVAQSLPPTRVLPNVGYFPLVTISEPCPAGVTGAPADQWLVTEDAVIQEVLHSKRRPIRPQTQTAIFIDLFDHKEAVVGPIGDGLEALYNLYVSNTFTITTDQLAVFLPGAADANLDTLVDWTGNAGLVVNEVRAITTARAFAGRPHTPLLALLLETLNQLPQPSGAVRQRLVVFSDGTDIEGSKAGLEAVVQEAKARRMPIDTLFIDTGYSDRNLLRTLANATGGRFVLVHEQKDKWQEFWTPLVREYDLCEITYRSRNRQPLTLTVQALVSGTVQFTQSYPFPVIDLPAPVVTITAPAGEQIVLSATAGLSNPQLLNLVVAWDFPAYATRKLKQIIYDVKGPQITPRTALTAPLSGKQTLILQLPLSGLPPGGYAIQVQVIDELGLTGSDRAAFALLAPPTATPIATPSPAITPLPSPTPTTTPTPTPLWYEPPLTWSTEDYPYRLFLVMMIPLLGVLAYGLYTLWRQRGDGESLPPLPTEAGAPVNAILYRVDGEPDQPLKQVVKLSDKSSERFRIPDGLYTYRGEAKLPADAKVEPLSLFLGWIKLHDSHYRLTLDGGSKPIKYKRRREEFPVNEALILEPNDTLIFGSVQYRFYFLTKEQALPVDKSEAPLGGQP